MLAMLAQAQGDGPAEVTLSWPEWAGGILALLSIAALLWRGWRRLRRRTIDPLSRLAAQADCLGTMARDWAGTEERPGFPAQPGVPVRLAGIEGRLGSVEGRLTTVEAELSPNGGRSMKDQVSAMAQRQGFSADEDQG